MGELRWHYPEPSNVRVFEMLQAAGYDEELSTLRDYLAGQRPRRAAHQWTAYTPSGDWLSGLAGTAGAGAGSVRRAAPH